MKQSRCDSTMGRIGFGSDHCDGRRTNPGSSGDPVDNPQEWFMPCVVGRQSCLLEHRSGQADQHA